jgi:hypothetical protein
LLSSSHCRRWHGFVRSFRIHRPAPPSLGMVLLPILSCAGTMRALTPSRLTLPERSLRLLRLAFHASRSQPLDGRAHRFDRHRSLSASQGFALQSRARRPIPPNRIRYPTGYAFASCCSPPRLAATRLLSASRGMAPRGGDFHPADKASSRTHDRFAPLAMTVVLDSRPGSYQHSSFLRRFRLQMSRQCRECVFAPGCSFLPSSFPVPPIFFTQVKGWRLFKIADGVLVGRVGAVSARPSGRGASLRQKGNPGVHGSLGL